MKTTARKRILAEAFATLTTLVTLALLLAVVAAGLHLSGLTLSFPLPTAG